MASLIDPSTALVADAYEAEARKVMAARAELPDSWPWREQRLDLLADVNELLERYNLLTLGR